METKFYKIITLLILGLCITVIFLPDFYLTSVQKTLLFLLAACIPALLFTKELDVKFDLSLPLFSITATGTAGLLLAVFLLLNHLTDQGPYVSIYEFTYPNGDPIQGLEYNIEIKPGTDAVIPTSCISNNKIFLVFNREEDIAKMDYRFVSDQKTKSIDLRYKPQIYITEILK